VGRTCNIAVIFTPKTAGSHPATLTIIDNAQGGRQTVNITGAGK
jgi:hypothetical protein